MFGTGKNEKLRATNKEESPILVLKPSTNETREGDIYLVGRELFSPTPESVNKLLELLNSFRTDIPSNVSTIDLKFPFEIELKKNKDVSLSESEKLASANECNILGGVFLNYVSSFGVEIGKVNNSFSVLSDDIEFMQTLYPDLAIYFASPEKLTQEEFDFKVGVIYNNTGSFRVIEVEDNVRIFTPEMLKKLAFLKRVFRHFAKGTIPFEPSNVRCNFVHTPETMDELSRHRALYDERINK